MGILVVLKSWLQKIKGTENVVQFLSGSEALPLPFSGEEEAEMLHRLEAGEDEEHVKAQLIEHNLRLVVYISQKFSVRTRTSSSRRMPHAASRMKF